MKRITGFTLVELLIVIALLGVLAAAVLAAINPLEQANRARDTRMRSDASQLLAAIDRYYVSIGHFPWFAPGQDDNGAYGFISAATHGVAGPGLCGTDCTGTNYGLLISNNELKSEFMRRDFVVATVDTDMLYIGKGNAGTTNIAVSVYACWVPKSKSERSKATKAITVGSPTMSDVTDCATRSYADLGTSCVACLPQ